MAWIEIEDDKPVDNVPSSGRWVPVADDAPEADPERASSVSPVATYMKNLALGMSGRFEEAATGLVGPLASQEQLNKVARQRQWMNENDGANVGGTVADVALSIPTMMAAPEVVGGGAIAAALKTIARDGLMFGAQGFATEPGGLNERSKVGAGDLVGGVVGSAAGQGIKGIMEAGKGAYRMLTDPFIKEGREHFMSNLLKQAVNKDQIPEVVNNLRTAPKLVPNYKPTAAEAGDHYGLSALQKYAEGINPGLYNEREAGNIAARKSYLSLLTKSPDEMVAAINKRRLVTEPLYAAAESQHVIVDNELRDLMKRPSIREAFMRGVKLSSEQGSPVSQQMVDDMLHAQNGAAINGKGLHYIKMGLDSRLKDPTNPMAGAEKSAHLDTIAAFDNWRERNIPDYAKAQDLYRKLSRPINQSDIGGAFKDKAYPAITDYGSIQRENPAAFTEAMKNGDKTVKQATGMSGLTLDGSLTKRQLNILNRTAQSMARHEKAKIGTGGDFSAEPTGMLSRTHGSFTNAITGIPGSYQLSSAAVLSELSKANKATKTELANRLLDPMQTIDLLTLAARKDPLSFMAGHGRNQIPGLMGYLVSSGIINADK